MVTEYPSPDSKDGMQYSYSMYKNNSPVWSKTENIEGISALARKNYFCLFKESTTSVNLCWKMYKEVINNQIVDGGMEILNADTGESLNSFSIKEDNYPLGLNMHISDDGTTILAFPIGTNGLSKDLFYWNINEGSEFLFNADSAEGYGFPVNMIFNDNSGIYILATNSGYLFAFQNKEQIWCKNLGNGSNNDYTFTFTFDNKTKTVFGCMFDNAAGDKLVKFNITWSGDITKKILNLNNTSNSSNTYSNAFVRKINDKDVLIIGDGAFCIYDLVDEKMMYTNHISLSGGLGLQCSDDLKHLIICDDDGNFEIVQYNSFMWIRDWKMCGSGNFCDERGMSRYKIDAFNNKFYFNYFYSMNGGTGFKIVGVDYNGATNTKFKDGNSPANCIYTTSFIDNYVVKYIPIDTNDYTTANLEWIDLDNSSYIAGFNAHYLTFLKDNNGGFDTCFLSSWPGTKGPRDYSECPPTPDDYSNEKYERQDIDVIWLNKGLCLKSYQTNYDNNRWFVAVNKKDCDNPVWIPAYGWRGRNVSGFSVSADNKYIGFFTHVNKGFLYFMAWEKVIDEVTSVAISAGISDLLSLGFDSAISYFGAMPVTIEGTMEMEEEFSAAAESGTGMSERVEMSSDNVLEEDCDYSDTTQVSEKPVGASDMSADFTRQSTLQSRPIGRGYNAMRKLIIIQQDISGNRFEEIDELTQMEAEESLNELGIDIEVKSGGRTARLGFTKDWTELIDGGLDATTSKNDMADEAWELDNNIHTINTGF